MDELEKIVFDIIINVGAARAASYDALKAAEKGDYEEAEQLLKVADEEVKKAHQAQTDVIQKEARGEGIPVTVLFVHAQDQLMTTLAERQLIENMIAMYKRIAALEKQ